MHQQSGIFIAIIAMRRVSQLSRHLLMPCAISSNVALLSNTPCAGAEERKTLLFNRSSFASSLSMQDYIAAVEKVHTAHAHDGTFETGLVHADAPEGEYHIKTGGYIEEEAAYYGLKANGGFFNNSKQGLPNILGMIYLSDATNAYPLAIFESSLISKMRTAAATAVCLKHLSIRHDKMRGPHKLGIIGYGSQAEAHVEALMCVTNIDTISIAGRNEEKAKAFVSKLQKKLGSKAKVEYGDSIRSVCEQSTVLITATPSTTPFIEKKWVEGGNICFIGAVGADSPGKQEFDPSLLSSPTTTVIGDIKSQIARVGESQHAVKAGTLPLERLSDLGELISGRSQVKGTPNEIVIYDSTGTALQDIATAAYIYEKLKDDTSIRSIDLFG